MQKKFLNSIDTKYGTFSVLTITYDAEGQEIQRHSESFNPSKAERAKEVLPENLYIQAMELWAPEVVSAYEQSLVQDIQPDINSMPQLPTFEERLNAIESAITEMAGEIYA